MEQPTRNALRNVVTQCRKLLEEAVAQELQGRFGLFAAGKRGGVTVEPDDRMTHLSEEDRTYRRDLLDHFEHIRAGGPKPKEALEQLIREVAFTHLNRLCAYRMMEARGLIRESVKRGLKSQGFLFYLADHPEDERRHNAGQQDVAYRHFLDWLGGTLSEEIGVLFAPTDPANRLYPPQRVLDRVIGLLNGDEIKTEETELRAEFSEIWSQDETIGWVYQYFTPKELRDRVRKASQAPRNSYELAFRNQFFTPRYVVEFLTDNTLGRIWYEMRKGETSLVDRCRYLVRRPTEHFLNEGEEPPAEADEVQEKLSQEELLRRPVHIPHRAKKDPRELKVLDPACGSGHFLLYAFDLLQTIYEEAYDDSELGPALRRDYPTLDHLRRDAPRLILARNLHGIDIDLRATQIAALALWLRCQRAWQEQDVRKADRPKVTRSNVVCAEPMPGEEALLDEFLRTLHEDRLERLIRRVMDVPESTPVRATEAMAENLSGLVRLVWDRMKLAGEAGSLLKIEEEIQEAIRSGRKKWEEDQPLFRLTEYSLSEEPTEKYFRKGPREEVSFWDRAEVLLIAALDEYASFAANGGKLLRTLFVNDALRGFAFVDLCRQRYDVVLMNPPFGEPSGKSKQSLQSAFPDYSSNLICAFLSNAADSLCGRGGKVGAVVDRTILIKNSYETFRRKRLLNESSLACVVDLGWGVLDANVEVSAVIVDADCCQHRRAFGFNLINEQPKGDVLRGRLDSPSEASHAELATQPFAAVTFDFPAFLRAAFSTGTPLRDLGTIFYNGHTIKSDVFKRLVWEVRGQTVNGNKSWMWNGSAFSPYYVSFQECVLTEGLESHPTTIYRNPGKHGLAGLCYGKRGDLLDAQVLPEGFVLTNEGFSAPCDDDDLALSVLALLNTNVLRFSINLYCGQHKGVGYVNVLPVPAGFHTHSGELAAAANELVQLSFAVASLSETDPHFLSFWPGGVSLAGCMDGWLDWLSSRQQEFCERQGELEQAILLLYQVGPEEDKQLAQWAKGVPKPSLLRALGGESKDELQVTFFSSVVSYAAGVTFGRWDLRRTLEAGTSELPSVPGQIAPSPPGMLTEPELASHPADEYPAEIVWDGILPEDPAHPQDVTFRILDVIGLIWPKEKETIEVEASEVLGVKTLRDYFRKPGKGGFWDDHVKRYSKSRRKAPIYWLLQSSKKNYGLWLYYHRLDKDLLFKALLNYVEPKLRLEQAKMDALRQEQATGDGPGREAKRLAKAIEKQDDLLSELRDFEDKLRRAAELRLDPDLNDGVVLNIAPLHELVPWKEAKKHWDKLTAGEYEWSSIGKQLREKGLVE